MSIAIFYGSTTGNTEEAAEAINEELGDLVDEMTEISEVEPDDLLKHDVLIFGIPTWNVGEMQSDFDDFVPKLPGLDLTGKKIVSIWY